MRSAEEYAELAEASVDASQNARKHQHETRHDREESVGWLFGARGCSDDALAYATLAVAAATIESAQTVVDSYSDNDEGHVELLFGGGEQVE